MYIVWILPDKSDVVGKLVRNGHCFYAEIQRHPIFKKEDVKATRQGFGYKVGTGDGLEKQDFIRFLWLHDMGFRLFLLSQALDNGRETLFSTESWLGRCVG